MKKSKALLITAMLASLALTSCGEQSYHGTYQFQMGKLNASHIGIYMDLTKDKIDVEYDGQKTTMEKFTLRFSAPDSAEQAAETTGIAGGMIALLEEGISGGYRIDDIEGETSDHIALVPVIDLNKIMNMVENEEESSSEPQASTSEESSSESDYTIPSEFVDDVLIAKYHKDTIEVTVPVSLTDLMFQLYWYGFDICDPLGEYELTPHEHGTHPTKEDIAKINETYNSEGRLLKHYDLDAIVKYKSVFKVVEYRDFNQLTMTLQRDAKL